MSDTSLLLLLDEVRGKTLRLLDDLTEAEARWVPDGLHNSILWNAGHAYVVVEALSSRGLGDSPSYPEGWFSLFSWESKPATIPSAGWPPLDAVKAQLEEQKARLHRRIEALSEAQLEQPSQGKPERTARFEILHALHDEACHCGEIWLMRKLQRAS